MIFGRLDKRRFDALAGYARQPEIALIMDELTWFADRDERALGMVVSDRIDDDFGWVALYQARRLNFGLSYRQLSHQTKLKYTVLSINYVAHCVAYPWLTPLFELRASSGEHAFRLCLFVYAYTPN